MGNWFRLFLAAALAVVACGYTVRASDEDPKSFDTQDGVRIDASFWAADPAAKKQRNATILLLHDLTGKNANRTGFNDVAKKLSEDGYSVLSFDFRGFGHSTTVGAQFWDPAKCPHNIRLVKGANQNPPPKTISSQDFAGTASQYYPYLVNDIAAAKDYLDQHDGQQGINASNVILIGAGEGATLGALWMESELHLHKVSGFNRVNGQRTFDDPEGQDLVGAVWLSMSPKLGGREVVSMARNCVADVTGANDVRTAFIYGKDDHDAAEISDLAMRSIRSRVARDNPKLNPDQVGDKVKSIAIEKPVPGTKLGGVELLATDQTASGVVKVVDDLMDLHGAPNNNRSHDVKKEDEYMWTFTNKLPVLAKARLIEDKVHILPGDNFIQWFSGN